MKSLTVRTNFIGHAPKEVRVSINEDKSIKQLIDENYCELLPRPDLFDAGMPNFVADWESLNEKSFRYFNSCYHFLSFQSTNTNDIPIHLVDRITHIKSDNIKLTPPRLMIDDSIAFFVVEKYGLNEKRTLPIDNDITPDGLREFLERLLSGTDTQLLVDNFSQRQTGHIVGSFIEQMIPAELWLNLSNEDFSYYKNFIIRFANEVLLIDYSVKNSTLVDKKILEDLSRGWMDNFLYQMQNLMLVLLSIPEIFIRSICIDPEKQYLAILQKKRITNLPYKKDDEYYFNHIVNQSISSVFFEILGDLAINNYQDYIKYCEDVPLNDINIGRIVNTYRVLCNKLKHSSYIKIIKSRDEEGLKRKELDEIDEEMKQLRYVQQRDGVLSAWAKHEIEKQEFLKDVNNKIRYAYGHLNFEDSEFKRNNGISVMDEAGNRFNITLFDMEVSLKVLLGILCILNRVER
ncbi:hypothetical protein ACFLWR_06825 [Chloroflexota bacterium]